MMELTFRVVAVSHPPRL
ncbi:hypothetical protein BDFB_002338 [Asbolus verrucosus]|uniref:Uncharacterized protein n=1 Tax=Asbolus verrucosus TaxID=1661398 RepID=A0A482VW22_ASBVE|nr:hypothetical protein BDFB_002338 [Asbolus verrucosus]